jgi:hypothetical protein
MSEGIAFPILALLLSTSFCAQAQQGLLRITSPFNGDVVIEGQPLRITVSADSSVRLISLIGGDPLPFAHPVGLNQFEMVVPKTVPPGKYSLTAVGVTTRDVESEPVAIQVEREDEATGLQAEPPFLAFAELEDSYGMPVRVIATFADGSRLDVTHSLKTSFTPKNPEIARVDDQARVIPASAGQTAIVVSYRLPSPSQPVYAAILVRCPLPRPTGPPPEIDSVTAETGVRGITEITIRGHNFGKTQSESIVTIGTQNGIVKRWSDSEIVATINVNTHRGDVCVLRDRQYSNAIPFTPVGLFIDGISGMPTPGKQIRIQGSGFGSAQGSGNITIAELPARVVHWTSNEIVVVVPGFTPTGSTFQVAVHQDGKLAEFRLISPRASVAK